MIVKENTFRSKRITLHRAKLRNGDFYDVYVYDLITGSALRFSCPSADRAEQVYDRLTEAAENAQ